MKYLKILQRIYHWIFIILLWSGFTVVILALIYKTYLLLWGN